MTSRSLNSVIAQDLDRMYYDAASSREIGGSGGRNERYENGKEVGKSVETSHRRNLLTGGSRLGPPLSPLLSPQPPHGTTGAGEKHKRIKDLTDKFLKKSRIEELRANDVKWEAVNETIREEFPHQGTKDQKWNPARAAQTFLKRWLKS